MLLLQERTINALPDSEIYKNSSSEPFEHEPQQNHVRSEKGGGPLTLVYDGCDWKMFSGRAREQIAGSRWFYIVLDRLSDETRATIAEPHGRRQKNAPAQPASFGTEEHKHTAQTQRRANKS